MENLKKVVDIIFDSGAFLVVILLILYSGYCYYARVSKNAEIEKSIENGYCLYVNGQRADANKIDIESLNGKIEINNKDHEIYVTFLH